MSVEKSSSCVRASQRHFSPLNICYVLGLGFRGIVLWGAPHPHPPHTIPGAKERLYFIEIVRLTCMWYSLLTLGKSFQVWGADHRAPSKVKVRGRLRPLQGRLPSALADRLVLFVIFYRHLMATLAAGTPSFLFCPDTPSQCRVSRHSELLLTGFESQQRGQSH